MSSALRNPIPSSEQSRSSSDVRLSVEQVSYAYAPNPSPERRSLALEALKEGSNTAVPDMRSAM